MIVRGLIKFFSGLIILGLLLSPLHFGYTITLSMLNLLLLLVIWNCVLYLIFSGMVELGE